MDNLGPQQSDNYDYNVGSQPMEGIPDDLSLNAAPFDAHAYNTDTYDANAYNTSSYNADSYNSNAFQPNTYQGNAFLTDHTLLDPFQPGAEYQSIEVPDEDFSMKHPSYPQNRFSTHQEPRNHAQEVLDALETGAPYFQPRNKFRKNTKPLEAIDVGAARNPEDRKRMQNTLAARKTRARREARQLAMEAKNVELRHENQLLKMLFSRTGIRLPETVVFDPNE